MQVSIALIFGLLRSGGGVSAAVSKLALAVGAAPSAGGAVAAEQAGRVAGALCLASWLSTLLFPAVVMGAALLGPGLDRGARALGRALRLALR